MQKGCVDADAVGWVQRASGGAGVWMVRLLGQGPWGPVTGLQCGGIESNLETPEEPSQPP